jgi:hypothetical protein
MPNLTTCLAGKPALTVVDLGLQLPPGFDTGTGPNALSDGNLDTNPEHHLDPFDLGQLDPNLAGDRAKKTSFFQRRILPLIPFSGSGAPADYGPPHTAGFPLRGSLHVGGPVPADDEPVRHTGVIKLRVQVQLDFELYVDPLQSTSLISLGDLDLGQVPQVAIEELMFLHRLTRRCPSLFIAGLRRLIKVYSTLLQRIFSEDYSGTPEAHEAAHAALCEFSQAWADLTEDFEVCGLVPPKQKWSPGGTAPPEELSSSVGFPDTGTEDTSDSGTGGL